MNRKKPDYRSLFEGQSHKVNTLSEYLSQILMLRQVENLTEGNFQEFLDKHSTEIVNVQNRSLYLPCMASLTQKAQAVGIYARQWA
jgi:hypothetical protein